MVKRAIGLVGSTLTLYLHEPSVKVINETCLKHGAAELMAANIGTDH
jgi:hypothetical protein